MPSRPQNLPGGFLSRAVWPGGKKAPAFFEFKRMDEWSIIRAYEKMGEMMDYETEGIAERNILHSSAGE
jgi:hypothetical protein